MSVQEPMQMFVSEASQMRSKDGGGLKQAWFDDIVTRYAEARYPDNLVWF